MPPIEKGGRITDSPALPLIPFFLIPVYKLASFFRLTKPYEMFNKTRTIFLALKSEFPYNEGKSIILEEVLVWHFRD